MNCQSKNCQNEAAKRLYRPVKEIRKDPVTKKKIWNESCLVCEECVDDAKVEYRYESYAPLTDE